MVFTVWISTQHHQICMQSRMSSSKCLWAKSVTSNQANLPEICLASSTQWQILSKWYNIGWVWPQTCRLLNKCRNVWRRVQIMSITALWLFWLIFGCIKCSRHDALVFLPSRISISLDGEEVMNFISTQRRMLRWLQLPLFFQPFCAISRLWLGQFP